MSSTKLESGPLRLPELLCQVYAHLTLPERIRASHVCSFWRNCALDSAQLWTDLRLGQHNALDIDILETFLPRTKGAPIVLQVACPDEEDVGRFTECLRQHMRHFRSLRIRLYLGCWEFICSAFLVPAPLLESLAFSGVTDARIPQDLFTGNAALLKTLRVAGFELPPLCPALASVTEFATTVDNNSATVATQEIRHLYDALPNLRELYLRGLTRRVVIPVQPLDHKLTRVELWGVGLVQSNLSNFRISEINSLTLGSPTPLTMMEAIQGQRISSASISQDGVSTYCCTLLCEGSDSQRIMRHMRPDSILHNLEVIFRCLQHLEISESLSGLLANIEALILEDVTIIIEDTAMLISPLVLSVGGVLPPPLRMRSPRLRRITVLGDTTRGYRLIPLASVHVILSWILPDTSLSLCDVVVEDSIILGNGDAALDPLGSRYHSFMTGPAS